MSTMTSTLHYAQVTTSFQPPPTQNTAPVIEHRCLYTQDLRRKAKRWQDGVLRFHTFNKRVMVYDVPRNYIGDTHWREDYPIQDGDELELDRPVLVQVGEQVGSVDQDLTELFEKRHKKTAVNDDGPGSHSSSPPAPLRSSGLRSSSVVAGKLVPKSLNALLGTPKGRAGRAQLPTKSPYELKVVNDGMERIAEPQAKRQRVERMTYKKQPVNDEPGPTNQTTSIRAGKENTHATDRFHVSSLRRAAQTAEQPRTFRPSVTGLSLSRSDLTVNHSPEAAAEAPYRSPPRIQSNTSRINVRLATAQVDEARQRRSPKARKSEERARPSITKGVNPELPSSPKICEPSLIINIPSDSEPCSFRSNERTSPKTKLQVISGKRRRKLMYKDLLPTDTAAPRDISRRHRNNHISNERQAQRACNPQSKQRQELERRRENGKVGRRKSEERRPSFTNDEHHVIEEPHRPPNPDNTQSEERTPDQLVTEISDGSRSQSVEVTESSIPRAAPTIHDTNAVLAHMDEILSSRSQIPTPSTMNPRSPLQKSNSDIPRTTAADAASDIGKRRCSLQKSKSDSPQTTVFHSISSIGKHVSVASATSAAKEQVISPWSREAWDLFGCGRDGKAVDFATFCMNEGV